MRPIKRLQMGKNGLTEEFVNQVRSVFKHEKIVKISVLRSASRNKEETKKMADDLVAQLGETYKYKIIGYVMTVMKFRKGALEKRKKQ